MLLKFGQDRRRIHKIRNLAHSAILIVSIGLLMSVCAYLIWGPAGIFWALMCAPLFLLFGPTTSPRRVMRMHRAEPLERSDGEGIYALVEALTERARLPTAPQLHFIQSPALNALAVGKPDNASIAITRGMLEKLSVRELAGVLAHEMSHIRNNDLWIMGFAGTMSRLIRALALVGLLLIFLNVPETMVGAAVAPWALALAFYLAPMMGGLLQLALARAREYDADLEAANLTGDPAALASALRKSERLRGRLRQEPHYRRRATPRAMFLCSHPPTEERVRRLLELHQPEQCGSWIPPQAALKRIPNGAQSSEPRCYGPGIWY